jgi:hypothetical protein
MKHGDKAKAKAAKAKASGKKASIKGSAKEKGGKGGKTVKAGGKKESSSPSKAKASKKVASAKGTVKTKPKAVLKASPKVVSSPKSSVKTVRADAETFTFTNPTIESAFKRAVKKYPNAFRRLTD